ncbi:MAG: adenine phosphoribosyltransferase [Verrucomicrobia bacterium]|nr:adenine phosphoribosyltransferase [Verrucomicrobiota bacterium]
MTASPVSTDDLRSAIRNVPDFPKPGIQFKDITPLLQDARLLAGAVEMLAGSHARGGVDFVAGIDARGFIFASAVATRLRAGFVPIRKKGKLPWRTHEQSYALEYGENTIALHEDAVRAGSRVFLVDDLLATGGTAGAAVQLLQKVGACIVEVAFLIELDFLDGRQRLPGVPVRSILHYSSPH